MKLMSKTFAVAAFSATAVTLSITNSAQALDFSFRGTFNNDNDVQLFNFTVGSTSNVTLKTLSYAGGTQADGTVISRGGFDPILALFDSSGNLIATNDDDPTGTVPTDTVTNRAYDTFLQSLLNAGNYTVAVSQFSNFANGPNISNGFIFDGQPNFRNGFFDVTGNQRTNAWAFDVLNVAEATQGQPIPTPALVPGAIAFCAGLLRKRKAEAAAEEAGEA